MNVLLLEWGDKRVLIDTGAGGIFGNDSGHLGENLAYAGLSPKDVTDVVLSHAHPDHIGGLTDKRSGELLYPNADVRISKEECTFWLSDIPDFSKSTMTDKTHMQMLVQVARRNINAAKTVYECITMEILCWDAYKCLLYQGIRRDIPLLRFIPAMKNCFI